MAKKHENYKPQKRGRLKRTVGYLASYDTTYMDREKWTNPETNEEVVRVFAACTCEKWRSSEEATTIQKVALEAKAHVESSPGCRLRKHSTDTHPLDVMTEEVG